MGLAGRPVGKPMGKPGWRCKRSTSGPEGKHTPPILREARRKTGGWTGSISDLFRCPLRNNFSRRERLRLMIPDKSFTVEPR